MDFKVEKIYTLITELYTTNITNWIENPLRRASEHNHTHNYNYNLLS